MPNTAAGVKPLPVDQYPPDQRGDAWEGPAPELPDPPLRLNEIDAFELQQLAG